MFDENKDYCRYFTNINQIQNMGKREIVEKISGEIVKIENREIVKITKYEIMRKNF